MRSSLWAPVLLAAFCFASSARAQAPRAESPGIWSGMIDLSFITGAVKPAIADDKGVGRGYGAQLGGGVVAWHTLALGIAFGVLSHGDEQPVTESTNAGHMDSRIGGRFMNLYTGLRAPILSLGKGQGILAGADLGWSWMTVYRAADCTGCSHTQLATGGFYAEPELAWLFHRSEQKDAEHFGLAVGYRRFLGSDYQDMILVKLGIF